MTGIEDEKALYSWVYANNARNLEFIRSASEIVPANKQHIIDFVSSCQVRNLSPSRISFYLQRLITMSKHFQKDFKLLSRQEVDNFMATVIRDSPWTRDNYVVTFQNLYRYLFNLASTDRLPDCVRGLKRTRGSNHLVPEKLLTQEEIDRVIEAIPRVRHMNVKMWRGMISTLYSTGVRPAECRGIKIGNCFPSTDPTDLSVRIRIEMGKTAKVKGERDVFIFIKRDYDNFMAWYNNHPRRDDANAWLFFQEVNHYKRDELGRVMKDSEGNDIILEHKIQPLTYPTLCNSLKTLARAANITGKIVTGYGYRHARAHDLYKSSVPHMIVAKMMGHSLEVGEKTYASLSSTTVANAMRRFEGQNVNNSPSSQPSSSPSISTHSPSQTLTLLRQSEQNPPSSPHQLSSSQSPPINYPSQSSHHSPEFPSQTPQNHVNSVNNSNNSTNYIDTQAPNTTFHEGNSIQPQQISHIDSQLLSQLPQQHINYAQNDVNYTRDITLQELQLRQYREQLNASAALTQQHCQCAHCQQQLMAQAHQSQHQPQPIQHIQPIAPSQQLPQHQPAQQPVIQRPQQPQVQSNQFLHQATPLPGAKKYPRSHLVEAVMGQIKMGLVNPDDVRRALDNLK
jgi:integrase